METPTNSPQKYEQVSTSKINMLATPISIQKHNHLLLQFFYTLERDQNINNIFTFCNNLNSKG